ncbi:MULTISPECIES: hypothetical protein [Haloferax]|uniref:DUF8080 domain-containing protein n=1 Tax=Haloferax marinum TaxID=2666143 RepID=A0A6A8G7N5_9EURY|nr:MULTISPECIES: hypothetical protein [Haloferax]KAB1197507.1 hypothetical protein Hfx1150_08245 [Haloferax sp. CBA1150]MRW96552.1 hypothetical protein [Haloferax marinum]
MHSDVGVTVVADVVLVTVTFENTDSVAQRVRLRNRLDGPVLPPRRAGVPEPGWDDDGFEGAVPAESTVALGYASPIDGDSTPSSDTDPESVVDIDVLGRNPDTDTAAVSSTDAIRRLGPSRPPADAVPAAEPLDIALARGDCSEEPDEHTADETVSLESPTSPSEPADSPSESVDSSSELVDSSSESATLPPEPTDEDVAVAVSAASNSTEESVSAPAATSAATTSAATTSTAQTSDYSSFLVAVERRIELAERLDGASVREAADAFETSDVSVDSVASLDADRARLRRLAAHATKLADRAADADPDVDSLRRVA